MGNPLLEQLIRRGGSHLIDLAVKRISSTRPSGPLPPMQAGAEIETKHASNKGGKPGSITGKLSGAALTRLAARSVPGAIIIGGGLLAKLAFDRKRARERGGD